MNITAAQLAQLLNATLEGNPDAAVSKPAPIEAAGPGDFTFLDNPRYENFAYSTGASVILVSSQFIPSQPLKATLIRVDDVRSSLAFLLEKFSHYHPNGGVSTQALVHQSARVGTGTNIGSGTILEEGVVIGKNCNIYPQVFIGKNSQIGDNTVIYPGVRVLHDCIIGSGCIVHGNAVIGSDGFGFAPQPNKTWKKVPQVGNVIVEDFVEIGACTCIDRAALGSTIIHSGAKLDNLIHIAHGVEVGANTVIAAQVGIAGSTTVGENCQLGGQAGLAGHITIADRTRLQAQSGVASSIKETDTALFGSPAFDYNEFVRAYVGFKQLPELMKKVRDLEKKIKDLER